MKLKIGLVLAAALVQAVPEAHAYIPPSGFLVKSLAAKRSGFKTVRIRSIVSSLSSATAAGVPISMPVHFREVTEYDFKTRLLRSRATDDTNQVVLYQLERRLPGAQPGVASSGAAIIDSVILDSNPDALARSLVANGIPVKRESDLPGYDNIEQRRAAEMTWLGRISASGAVSSGASSSTGPSTSKEAQRTAWVIGGESTPAKRLENLKPQFWIEKDTFLPLRIVFPDGDGFLDAHLDGNRTFHELSLPKAIVLFQASSTGPSNALVPIMKDELAEAAVDVELTVLSKSGESFGGFTEAGNASSPELQELLRRYYGSVR